MGDTINFDYYYGIEAEQFSFYRVPRLLIKDERFKGLSSDAKLLYGLMLDRMSLSMKNGWLDDDFFVRLGEDIHHESDTFYNTWNEADPLSLYIPLVVVMHPVDDAGQIIFRLYGVAEKRVFQSCLEGICNERWGLEIHISYPEWQQIISPPTRQQGAMLQVVAARTVYDLIEIVHFFNF